MKNKSTILICSVLVVVAVLFVGTNVFAAVTGNTITACISKDGEMKISQDGTTCAKGQTLLSWNIQGPKGEQGATGGTGPQGPQGDTGATGPHGPSGLTGEQGLKGDPGPTGQSGEKGEAGNLTTQIITGTPVTISLSSEGNVYSTATCPEGKSVLGGGETFSVSPNISTIYPQLTVNASYPSNIDTWTSSVKFVNVGAASTITLTTYAICSL